MGVQISVWVPTFKKSTLLVPCRISSHKPQGRFESVWESRVRRWRSWARCSVREIAAGWGGALRVTIDGGKPAEENRYRAWCQSSSSPGVGGEGEAGAWFFCLCSFSFLLVSSPHSWPARCTHRLGANWPTRSIRQEAEKWVSTAKTRGRTTHPNPGEMHLTMQLLPTVLNVLSETGECLPGKAQPGQMKKYQPGHQISGLFSFPYPFSQSKQTNKKSRMLKDSLAPRIWAN